MIEIYGNAETERNNREARDLESARSFFASILRKAIADWYEFRKNIKKIEKQITAAKTDAMRCRLRAELKDEKRQFSEVSRYLFSHCEPQHESSFNGVCFALDINPGKARAALQRKMGAAR